MNILHKGVIRFLIFCVPVLIFLVIRFNNITNIIENARHSSTSLQINEVMADNLTGLKNEKGIYSDWIEIYNGTEQSLDLTGYYLSDSKNDLTKWKFPEYILDSGEYVIVFCDGYIDESNKFLHANFKINSDNDEVYLSNEDEEVVDFVKLNEQKTNISYGRSSINSSEWGFFSYATPAKENPVEFWQKQEVQQDWGPITFSHEAGSYSEAFNLQLSCEYEDGVILYTLDGSEPDFDSKIYSSEILIEENNSENKYVNQKSIYSEDNYETEYGVNNVYKGTVVRARVLKDGRLSKTIDTKTYFITPDYTLPIVSLSSNPYDLFDKKNGGYVLGSIYYTARKYGDYGPRSNLEINQDFKGHIEIFDTDGRCSFKDDIVFSVSGGSSSQINIQKNFKVSLDNEEISAKYFGRDADVEYDSFYLRGSGGSNFMGDMYMYPSAFITNALQEANVGAQASVPVILFIDGEYWGIYTLMEPKGKEYISKNYNIPKSEISIVQPFDGMITTDFEKLRDEIYSKDLSTQQNYEWLKQHIDMKNYMQFVLAQGFYNNYDGLKKGDHNYLMWRDEREGSEYGKWQWHLFDMDKTMNDFDDFIEDMLTVDLEKFGKNSNFSLNLFNMLWKNTLFQQELYDLYCRQLNGLYNKDNVIKRFNEHVACLEPEMKENIERYARDYTDLKKLFYVIMRLDVEYKNYSMEDWYKVEDYMLGFLETRSEFFRECFVKHMSNKERYGY